MQNLKREMKIRVGWGEERMDILELKKKYLKYLGLTINYTSQVKRLVSETGQKELYLNQSSQKIKQDWKKWIQLQWPVKQYQAV